MNAFHRNRHARGGVTLVELLVVVTILMLLAAFAIPAIRPMTEGRRIREAVRAVDVFFTRARTRSVELQRPVGVVLQRMQQTDPAGNVVYQDDACNVLRMVEIPPPYAGDFSDSRVRVQNWTAVLGGGNYIVLKLLIKSGDFSDRLLKEGDQVQLDFQGPLYEICLDPVTAGSDFPVDADGYLTFTSGTDANGGNGWYDQVLTVRTSVAYLGGVPWPATASGTLDTTNFFTGSTILWSADVPFQIFRQPEASPGDPLRLPKNTVIDLADSGYLGTSPDTFGPVDTPLSTSPELLAEHRGPMILFAPSGAISAVYHWDTAGNYGPQLVMNPVFLMVGKWERTGLGSDGVSSLADDGLHNWQDASNLWLAVGPQNSLLTAAEVFTDTTTPAGVSVPSTIAVSRTYAREAQISKGALEE